MKLIITLDDEAGGKRPFLPIESNIQQNLLSINMWVHLWSLIVIVVVGLKQHTGSGGTSQTFSITDDLPWRYLFFFTVSC